MDIQKVRYDCPPPCTIYSMRRNSSKTQSRENEKTKNQSVNNSPYHRQGWREKQMYNKQFTMGI